MHLIIGISAFIFCLSLLGASYANAAENEDQRLIQVEQELEKYSQIRNIMADQENVLLQAYLEVDTYATGQQLMRFNQGTNTEASMNTYGFTAGGSMWDQMERLEAYRSSEFN